MSIKLILHHKMKAKQSYDYLLSVYNETKDIYNEKKLSYELLKAQVTVYSGVYNRDYKEYKKGVEKFADVMKKLKELPKNVTHIRIKENEETQERDYMNMSDWCDYKYNHYKNLYNILPRGYFKSK